MTKEAKKTLLSLGLVILGLVSLVLAKPLFASVRCETQYEGEVCWELKLELIKKVWDPDNGEFKENLANVSSDYIFGSNDEVTFQLKIKNVGDKKLDIVEVRDYLPEYLEPFSGDISFQIYDLEVDETEVREFTVKVVSDLPDNEIICDGRALNKAVAWSGDEVGEDTSQICVEEKVLGVKVVEELPPTGPQYGIILLGVSMLSGLAGLVFKKINWL